LRMRAVFGVYMGFIAIVLTYCITLGLTHR
jgi:hypothetical protein